MRKLKLIWDFKGPDAELTAQHHLTHLKDYLQRHEIQEIATGMEKLNDKHHLCYVAVAETDMPKMRDELKPHRGQLWMN